jgi:L-ascorbate metabolism protein UlaG (beta-lactamase superfamily)
MRIFNSCHTEIVVRLFGRRSPPLIAMTLLLLATACQSSRLRLPFNRPALPLRSDTLWQRDSSMGPVTVWFLGTSSLAIRDSSTTIVADGFLTRPGRWHTISSRYFGRQITSNAPVIDAEFRRVLNAPLPSGSPRGSNINALFVVQTHYDHAMDATYIARRHQAMLFGSNDLLEVAKKDSVPESLLRSVDSSSTVGAFALSFKLGKHGEPNEVKGATRWKPEMSIGDWKDSGSYVALIKHAAGTMLIYASAAMPTEKLPPADVVFLGIAGLRRKQETPNFLSDYWRKTVCETGARRVVLVHWDEPTSSLEAVPKAVPYRFGRIDEAIEMIRTFGERDSVEVILPVAMMPMNPFDGLRAPRCN